MKKYVGIIILFLMLSGCNHSGKEDINWFNTENDAIQHGLKEESIDQAAIISKVTIDGELFIVYKKEEDDQLIIGLSNIANKDEKYTWYRNDVYVGIQADVNVSLETKSLSGSKFNLYTGIAEGKEPTIETNLGTITPHIDELSGIYYLVTPVK